MKEEQKGEIVIYKIGDGKIAIEINLSEETLWLTQHQLSVLFDRDRSVIMKHLHNMFKSGDLKQCAKNTPCRI